MSWITAIYDTFFGSESSGGMAACTPPRSEQPPEPPAPTAPAPTVDASAEDAGQQCGTAEEIHTYLQANQTIMTQLQGLICEAPQENYYICSLSRDSGRQGQTIEGLVLHGFADDLNLSDPQVVRRLTVVFAGEGITVSNLRVVDNELVVDIAIAADAPRTKSDVYITIQDGQELRDIGRLTEGFEVKRRGGGGRRPTTPTTPTQPTGNMFEP
jgi:hypothetical protein